MSTPLAIAAVTEVLVEQVTAVLSDDLGLTAPDLVTVGSPQLAREGRKDPQLNLFLYQVTLNAAWRNQDLPAVKPGERAAALLPLCLYYLVTAFGDKDDDRMAHQMLGSVMLKFHNQAVLPKGSAAPVVANSQLGQQFEPVRLTLQPLSIDEMSKLWSGMQSQFRLSVGYEASVVLIESGKPTKSAPPVLSRGAPGDKNLPGDRGFPADAFVGELVLDSIQYAAAQPGLIHGSKLTFRGKNLDRDGLRLMLRHPRLPRGRIARLGPGAIRKADRIEAKLPDDFIVVEEDANRKAADLKPVASDRGNWPAGIYSVSGARLANPSPANPDLPQNDREPLRLYTTSPIPLALLPEITMTPLELVVSRNVLGNVTDARLSVSLASPLHLGANGTDQSVKLFAGSLELVGIATVANRGSTLLWVGTNPADLMSSLYGLPLAALFVRVQVDGVDSSLLPKPTDPDKPERKYDPALLLNITDPGRPPP